VLALLVAVSLILLTAYFGESPSSPLHTVQRGLVEVLSPIQEGASRALKPFRDLFGWVGDTLDAKKERDALLKKNEALERQVTDLQAASVSNQALGKLAQINDAGGMSQYAPVRARVTARPPNLFYARVTIDKGTSAGVRVDQPVVNGDGLVGRVSQVTAGYSIVTLISDDAFAAAARTLGHASRQGTVEASINTPGDLELKILSNPAAVRQGDRVVTDGSTDARLRSYFPPDIPIGRVSRISLGDGDLDRTIHLRPAVDLGNLDYVEVLTRQAPVQTVASANGAGAP
jgi:rod shape-determining protein MreC